MNEKGTESLEGLLMRAATEPAARPDFYAALLAADVLVIGNTGEGEGPGEHVVKAGANIQIQNWSKPDGSMFVPFFSSLAALQHAITDEVGYLSLPARSLFEITAGASLVLNPSSSHGKEFFPEEIQQLLATGLAQSAHTRVVEKDTRVLLGQPKQRPEALLTSLRTLFATRANVKCAYFALMHDASVDSVPHLIIGIELEGDEVRLMQEAGNVAAGHAADFGPVDLLRIRRPGTGPAQYFYDDCEPFYQRASKPGFFASLFSKR